VSDLLEIHCLEKKGESCEADKSRNDKTRQKQNNKTTNEMKEKKQMVGYLPSFLEPLD